VKRGFAALTALLLLAGCAQEPPIPIPTPTTPSPTPRVVFPTTTPTAGVETPVVVPTPEETGLPDGPDIVLGGDRIGDFKFGASEAEVTAFLDSRLGEPDDQFSDIFCSFSKNSPWANTVTYGGLSVIFLAADQSETSPRTLKGWGYQMNPTLSRPFVLADGLDPTLSFKKLKQKYPKGKLEDMGYSQVFTAPNKILLIDSADDGKASYLSAGYSDPECD
jgi:hypothetical protein